MFRWFEQRIDPFRDHAIDCPPNSLVGFYTHYLRQVWPTFLAVMVVGLAGALVEVSLFAFLGEIVDLIREAETPATFFADHGTVLIIMGLIALVVRPVLFTLHALAVNQTIVPGLTNLVRWQNHRWLLRQSMSYFESDFAGRIANRVMQTGPSLRESAAQSADAIWFVSIYTVAALVLFLDADPLLMIPLVLWVAGYIVAMFYFVPRIQRRSTALAHERSAMTGRIVDSYTNMLTVKLFAHAAREDAYAREVIDRHTEKLKAETRMISLMEITVLAMNSFLIVGTAGLGLWLWSGSAITVGAVALSIGLVLRINNMSMWIMWTLTGIFENIGTVHEGMETISRPHSVVDAPDAPALSVRRGDIRYDQIRFHYGKGNGVIDDLSLSIRAGEKVGLVGRSGAGKSTLVSVLLRFYDLEGGRILIDGQDIAGVTQDSLRAQIGMVTPGHLAAAPLGAGQHPLRPSRRQTMAEVDAAVRRAHAHLFIDDLVDGDGRRGYDAHVGERGVKLSGGQRQRIAIARVIVEGRADPGPGRSNLGPGLGGRGRDPGATLPHDGRQDRDRHRPPPVDHRGDGPVGDHGQGPDHRRGLPRPVAAARRPVCRAVGTPVGRLPGEGERGVASREAAGASRVGAGGFSHGEVCIQHLRHTTTKPLKVEQPRSIDKQGCYNGDGLGSALPVTSIL